MSAKKFQSRGRSKRISSFIVNKRSIVPNIITMSNLTMGFFAIIFAGRGDPYYLALAGVLVFVGSFFDAMDGAVARAMHVESPVGIQLDSLADGIAYGIAPAVIAYHAYLQHIPGSSLAVDSGLLIALIYPICAIYRLARFNISAEEDDHTGFSGLPSPAAGILISSIPALEIAIIPFIGDAHFSFPIYLFVPLYVAVSLLMVSRLEYGKFYMSLIKKGKIVIVLTIVFVILALGFFRMWSVFVVTFLYTLIGALISGVRSLQQWRKAR